MIVVVAVPTVGAFDSDLLNGGARIERTRSPKQGILDASSDRLESA